MMRVDRLGVPPLIGVILIEVRELFMETHAAVKGAISPTANEVETLSIDPAHSFIGFSVRHMVISRVWGRFTRFSGTISYNRLDPARSSFRLTIGAASLNTENSDRDSDLQSARFFDTGRFPQITFRSRQIEQTCEGYVCAGSLTLHGVTEEIAIPFEITGRQTDLQGRERIGFEGQLKLDRRKFGLTYNTLLANGGPVVGNEIAIYLSIEAVQE